MVNISRFNVFGKFVLIVYVMGRSSKWFDEEIKSSYAIVVHIGLQGGPHGGLKNIHPTTVHRVHCYVGTMHPEG